MGVLDQSAATLRIFGEELLPDELTTLLGASPTASYRRGDERHSPSGKAYVEKTGSWRLSVPRRRPEDLEGQIFEILDRLTSDISVWRTIADRFELELFCSIYMANENDRLELSPKAMLALGERGIRLGLDIYDERLARS